MSGSTNVSVLKAGFAKLHESEVFSDCKIICGPYHFNLHKAVLGSQSEYFLTALKSGTFKEGQSGIIELKAATGETDQTDDACDDPEIVKLMIEYFYHFDYLRHEEKPHLIEHAKVFALAVKYQAGGLRDLAVAKFKEEVQSYWNHEDFAHAIHVVYTSTVDDAKELRDLVADTIHEHFNVLKDKDEIEVVVGSIGTLAYGLLKRRGMGYRCRRGDDMGSLVMQCAISADHSFMFCKTCYPDGGYRYCPVCGEGSYV